MPRVTIFLLVFFCSFKNSLNLITLLKDFQEATTFFGVTWASCSGPCTQFTGNANVVASALTISWGPKEGWYKSIHVHISQSFAKTV